MNNSSHDSTISTGRGRVRRLGTLAVTALMTAAAMSVPAAAAATDSFTLTFAEKVNVQQVTVLNTGDTDLICTSAVADATDIRTVERGQEGRMGYVAALTSATVPKGGAVIGQTMANRGMYGLGVQTNCVSAENRQKVAKFAYSPAPLHNTGAAAGTGTGSMSFGSSGSSCPASGSWHDFGFGKGGDRRVGSARVDVGGAVPGQGLVGSDCVELDAVHVGLADEVQGVVDVFAVEPLILQRAERALADAVLAG